MHAMPRLLLAFAALALLLPSAARAQEAPTGLPFTRPADQRGLHVFETPKGAPTPFQGVEVHWGAAFTQQFQALEHSNDAEEALHDGVDANELYPLGYGFNNATANLALDARLAPGVRVNLVTYLSSRHHQEAWVKGGYLQVDDVAFLGLPALDRVMEYVTVKAGHYEINYGDAHFRRTDNGNALYNPFVGNYLLDAFTTEIGAEITAQYQGGLAVLGLTGGEIKGDILKDPERKRAPSFYAKLGLDRQVREDLRLRLTGSLYTTSSSFSNTLYAGDRTGSRYYLVMENTAADAMVNFRSGRVNPGFGDAVTAFQINPFVKFQGLELFGVVETASGRAHAESENRTWSQYAAEAVYRFLPREQLFLGARYNTASGRYAGFTEDVRLERIAVGAGWFITPNVLTKLEYVSQKYHDFPAEHIHHGGSFNGLMIEGVVAF